MQCIVYTQKKADGAPFKYIVSQELNQLQRRKRKIESAEVPKVLGFTVEKTFRIEQYANKQNDRV